MESIRVLKKNDYDQLYLLRRICFDILTEDYENYCRENYYDEENWIGLFYSHKLVSVVWIKPLFLNFNSIIVKAGGLGSVATLPEFRNRGYSKTLINKALEEMNSKGYLLSSLAPFLQSFYEKFGYVHSFDFKEITYQTEKLKHLEKEYSVDEVNENHCEELIKARQHNLNRYQLMGYRNEYYTKQYLKKYDVKQYRIVRIGDEGYLVFKEYQNMVKLIEIEYKNIEILSVLLAYIYNVYSNKEKIVIVSPDDNIIKDYIGVTPDEEKILYGKMTKVINVKKILEMTSFGEDFVMKVDNEKYDIKNRQILMTDKEEDIAFSIQSFTQYILGIRALDDLLFLGQVKMRRKLDIGITKKIIYENEGY
ncbi:MAG: GNAT family N-acetyltransferase [Clostridia bacterium]|nr:GNAT family N-acetyltransferase [Clostridia bacterium]